MGPASASGTSRPGQPYHWKLVALDSPLRPVTRPPEDMEKEYWPSSERLMVIGRRLEMRSRRPDEPGPCSTTPGIVEVVDGGEVGDRIETRKDEDGRGRNARARGALLSVGCSDAIGRGGRLADCGSCLFREQRRSAVAGWGWLEYKRRRARKNSRNPETKFQTRAWDRSSC